MSGPLKAEKGITVEELQENSKFVDSVMNATRIAMHNNSEKKRAALKNAMFNSALSGSLEESKQQLFLHMIGELAEAHLQILSVLDSPKTWYARQNRQPPVYHITGSIHAMLRHALHAFQSDGEFLEFVFRDLYQRSLIGTDALKAMMSGSGPLEERTTQLGRAFLRYVAEPYPW